MRILVIESDASCAESVEGSLKIDLFNVYTTGDAEEGLALAKLYDYDCVVSGYDTLRGIRRANIKTPVLILSGLTGIDDKVKGLNAGADDYMTKPFHRDELVARVRAIIRRSRGHAQSTITTGDLVLNLDMQAVSVAGQRVKLTGKEYEILELLSLRKGITVTKEMFLNHLYGERDEPDSKIIDVFICKLRKKLEAASEGKRCIETIWGRGYILRDPNAATVDKAPVVRNPVGYGGQDFKKSRHGDLL